MTDQTPELINLTHALAARFSSDEARNLAYLLATACRGDSVSYDEIDIPAEIKDDVILLAYEERMLLPMKSIRGSAWEDRILNFADDERYHLPRVVRFLVEAAARAAKWSPDDASTAAMTEAGEPYAREMTQYLNLIKETAPTCQVEIGAMQAISGEMDVAIDMHDTLDRFVRCGIMSPRTQRSLHAGTAKFEVNPCLYWKS